MSIILKGFIYLATTLIFEESNYYKIGSCNDLDQCLIEMNEQSPSDWFLISYFECDDCQETKSQMHEILSKNHRKRDFFKFTDSVQAISKFEDAYIQSD